MKFSDARLIVNKMLLGDLILVGYNLVVLLEGLVITFKLTGLISFEILKLLVQLIKFFIFCS